MIKACKESLSEAFTLLWKYSYNNSSIPQCFKNQFIAPIYKKDSKLDPANYRPVSLTSHVIIIFERVMRKHLVRYLEDNNLLSNKQHGFRKGSSCLTQLLKHYDKILNNYLNSAETDAIQGRSPSPSQETTLLRYRRKDLWLDKAISSRKNTNRSCWRIPFPHCSCDQ